jgi:hypothetical protein
MAKRLLVRAYRVGLSTAAALTVVVAFLTYNPAVAKDNGTWTFPYTGTLTSTGTAVSISNNGTGYGITAHSGGTTGTAAIYGSSTSGEGVSGDTATFHEPGVVGVNYATTGDSIGVEGTATASTAGVGVEGNGGAYGVSGVGTSLGVFGGGGTSGDGVEGSADTGSGNGVVGLGHSGYGVYGSSDTNYAGYFAGNLYVSGSITAGTKDFAIDHPLDPANKYLMHACVESNEMLDVYSGTAVADSNGRSTVVMPSYFEALNKNFRYQLTCTGGFAPVYIDRKLTNNQFTIAGADPGMEVSWQVTGTRHDAYAEAHPLVVEKDKPAAERGKFMHPVELGEPVGLGIGHDLVERHKRLAEQRLMRLPRRGATPDRRGDLSRQLTRR